MKAKLFLFLLLVFTSGQLFSQTNGGQSWYMDYIQFTTDNTVRYIKFPHKAALNTGDELTVETWMKVYDSGWNQKIIGKTNISFNSGWILAIDQGKIYPEVWNPAVSTMLAGFIPPVPIPGYWYHLAMTYTKADSLISYVNGKRVGGVAVANNPVSNNTEPLTIGIAPWGEFFQFFGNLDEVRIWNIAKTQQEIQNSMFIELNGNESGLVAYYTFNTSTPTSVVDETSNAIDGSMVNGIATNLVTSTCLVAGSDMNAMNDISALWNGLGFIDPRFVITSTGLSMLANGIIDDNHAIFGHDNESGTTTVDNPTNAPANFEHATRVFYIEQNGGMVADLMINLEDIAAGGAQLTDTKPADHYLLLFRSVNSGAFTIISAADTKNNKTLTYSNAALQNGYYTIGVGDSTTSGEATIDKDLTGDISLYPNPNMGEFNLSFNTIEQNAIIEVYNATGGLIYETEKNTVDNTMVVNLEDTGPGVYYLRVTTENTNIIKRFVVR